MQSLLQEDAFGLRSEFVGMQNFIRLWNDATYLAALRERQPSLADLLERRGRLERGPAGARLMLTNLGGDDARLAGDRRNQRAIERALTGAMPGAQLSVDANAPADEPQAPPAPSDPFTQEVVDLFGGRIEETR